MPELKRYQARAAEGLSSGVRMPKAGAGCLSIISRA
jgi:hypothetical protein